MFLSCAYISLEAATQSALKHVELLVLRQKLDVHALEALRRSIAQDKKPGGKGAAAVSATRKRARSVMRTTLTPPLLPHRETDCVAGHVGWRYTRFALT
jgi:hypothetical protein